MTGILVSFSWDRVSPVRTSHFTESADNEAVMLGDLRLSLLPLIPGGERLGSATATPHPKGPPSQSPWSRTAATGQSTLLPYEGVEI